MTRKDYKKSVSEKGDAARGSSTSLGSALSSRAASRCSSVGPENGDIDYKKLYEEQLGETHKVNERLRSIETELRQSRESIDLSTKKFNTRLAIAESEKKEKRTLERKLSEMEEELKDPSLCSQWLSDRFSVQDIVLLSITPTGLSQRCQTSLPRNHFQSAVLPWFGLSVTQLQCSPGVPPGWCTGGAMQVVWGTCTLFGRGLTCCLQQLAHLPARAGDCCSAQSCHTAVTEAAA
ncbi:Protein phosphatase 1 regulatory subunit 12A [Chionoecetes opilio]|uniref:Protein phosphatase 1 regulatory subunit 12A n=1 Tax=Chionoecetes opilio TaxID=41210 RepID=A0A8J5CSQ2_CHIOP|nr:Protein phosphatase 1 regulatory subunit 12A [Chionoecetes opilio]